MSIGVLIPLALFFAMGVVVVALLWRLIVVGGEARRTTQQGRAAADLAHRADISLTELCAIIDDLRRRRTGPEDGASSLGAAADGLRRYILEAEAISRKGPAPEAGATLTAEIVRAQRAVDLIEHGRVLMMDRSLDRIGEGETAVKRGYLNLVHAREAIRAQGEEITRHVNGDLGKWSQRG
jgi:hypothetical protein